MAVKYYYTKQPVAIDSLSEEILASSISSSVYNYATHRESNLAVVFEDELSIQDKETLDNVVSAHAGIPIFVPQGKIFVANGLGGVDIVDGLESGNVVTNDTVQQSIDNYITNPEVNANLMTVISGSMTPFGTAYFHAEAEGETNTNRNYYASYGQNSDGDCGFGCDCDGDDDKCQAKKKPWLSTGYLGKVNLDIPVIDPGVYRVSWYYEWRRNTVSSDFMGTVSIDGTTLTEHRQESKDVNSWHINSGFKTITLSDTRSHVVSLAYCGDAGGNTISYIRKARLEFWRIR